MSERKILFVRHRIMVDGRVIYEGGEWGESGRGDVYRIFMDAVAMRSSHVIHEVLKQVISLNADPSTIVWHWASAGDDAI